jgi:hypothetical protein
MTNAILAAAMLLAGGAAVNADPLNGVINVNVQASQFAQGTDPSGTWYKALLQVRTTQGRYRISGHITLTSRSPIDNVSRGTLVPVTITLPGATATDKTSVPWSVRQLSNVGSDYWVELCLFAPGSVDGVITLMSPAPFGLAVGDAVPVSFTSPGPVITAAR